MRPTPQDPPPCHLPPRPPTPPAASCLLTHPACLRGSYLAPLGVSRGQASKLLTPGSVPDQFGHSALWALVEVIGPVRTGPWVFHGPGGVTKPVFHEDRPANCCFYGSDAAHRGALAWSRTPRARAAGGRGGVPGAALVPRLPRAALCRPFRAGAPVDLRSCPLPLGQIGLAG